MLLSRMKGTHDPQHHPTDHGRLVVSPHEGGTSLPLGNAKPSGTRVSLEPDSTGNRNSTDIPLSTVWYED